MIAIDGQPILTAAQMRAAEDAAIAAGSSVTALMQRAGEGIAAATRRLVAGAEVLIVCGPGNNGGDGYVAATALAGLGHPVRVAASGPPKTDAAIAARAGWTGPIEALTDATPAPILLDCLFGTGLTRPLAPEIDAALARLSHAARLVIAADLPSGTNADTAEAPDWAKARPAALTLALGALKPAHGLHPAAAACGTIRLIDLGIDRPDAVTVAARPALPQPGPASHKYTRGMVAIVAGAMEGAARLAAVAALRSGAGYVALYGGSGQGGPDAIVHRPYEPEALADERIGAILIGPGLGRDDEARAHLQALIEADTHRLVIDGDALHLLDPDALRRRHNPVVLTPHAGEFHALFGTPDGSLLDRARTAAARAGVIVVLKGPTTIVADAARVRIHLAGNPWLSTAGTGDVLAGTIAAQLAHPHADPMAAADAGVWLHARAAWIAGKSFIADDLANALTPARAGA
ncbi:NAD(P)H-hydrate dehydratase [Sphingomonas sp. RP10(2022)]|uniref:Bifunctional NAD(P)H-hydrate repair enzyme n=1 Tax=Sphingomonas liriopis TaxID=2949094 RepID=A0A9X2HSL3_9SPHN|nr:NAD(P)H-hydrate dehydratase [Sphingomonas liriopis]MCP3733581.1 NAD(P)H-hydrate dehydratase [Sphingomonas liriopis]